MSRLQRCRFYDHGDCRYGDDCRFAHVDGDHPGGGQGTQRCIYYDRGYCVHGDDCRFAHVDSGDNNEGYSFYGDASDDEEDEDHPGGGQGTQRCIYYDRGYCVHGDDCRFAHVDSGDNNEGCPSDEDAYYGDAVQDEEVDSLADAFNWCMQTHDERLTRSRHLRTNVSQFTEEVWEFNQDIDRLTGRDRSDIEGEAHGVDHIIEIQMWNEVWNRVEHLASSDHHRKSLKKQIIKVCTCLNVWYHCAFL